MYLRFEGSEHRPLLTFFDTSNLKKFGLFRYDRRLRNNEEVKQIIKHTWTANSNESVMGKIRNCRQAISLWNKEDHKNSRLIVEEKKRKLNEEMAKSVANEALIHSLNTELKYAYKDEEEYWKQRSRKLWLALGDKILDISTQPPEEEEQLTSSR